ncbi:hypothetical protein LEMLEM_LOCUS4739 [Lemmus lemmus]
MLTWTVAFMMPEGPVQDVVVEAINVSPSGEPCEWQ